jgi:hypothetical protein
MAKRPMSEAQFQRYCVNKFKAAMRGVIRCGTRAGETLSPIHDLQKHGQMTVTTYAT